MLPAPSRRELRRRLPRLTVGLVAFGVGIALMVRSDLGLGPWDVLHQGISERTGIPIGTVGILVGVLLLAAWPPLWRGIGVGTLANVIVIGLVVDATLWLLPGIDALAVRVPLLVSGIVGIGLGSGAYIGAGLGPGPRDALMTTLAERGWSIRLVRTLIEVTVLVLGWLLGGTVGVGTVLLALTIGPLVQLFLGWFSLPPLLPSTPEPAHPHPAR